VSATRPTGEAAYRDGTGTFHPETRRIVRGADLPGDTRIEVDACVIGAGAGGAVAAKELAEGGMRVALLEEGEWEDTDTFTARPREMTTRLYRDAGQVATLGRPPILLPLGRGVGGTTLINSATCFRTPAPVLEHWRDELGLDELTEDELEPWFRRVERELNVVQVPPDLAGRNADVVRRGVERLGWSGDYLYRNVRGCVGAGVCAFGCPSGAKQHTGVTYVPKAWAAGATTYTGARADRIDVRRGQARGVEARTSAGGRLRVDCRHVVLAAGAVHTPLLLRRNGLGTDSGWLGSNLSIHPCTAVKAIFDERIDMWHGVPQSYYCDELAAEGVMLEGAAGPPDYIAASIPRAGDEHRALMERYPHMSQFGIMICDVSRGRVREAPGGARPLITYDLDPRDARAVQRGIEALCEIYWAAGARQVVVPIPRVPVLRDGETRPFADRPLRPSDLTLMAFHPLGTARAGADPAASVVDGRGRVHGVAGVHVLDGAIVPSALGVNPQITIMALATRAAFALLDAPRPDEPAPEHMASPHAATPVPA
jgi:choline dehydrogenase-like flavoprotein